MGKNVELYKQTHSGFHPDTYVYKDGLRRAEEADRIEAERNRPPTAEELRAREEPDECIEACCNDKENGGICPNGCCPDDDGEGGWCCVIL